MPERDWLGQSRARQAEILWPRHRHHQPSILKTIVVIVEEVFVFVQFMFDHTNVPVLPLYGPTHPYYCTVETHEVYSSRCTNCEEAASGI